MRHRRVTCFFCGVVLRSDNQAGACKRHGTRMKSLKRTRTLAELKRAAGCADCGWDEDPDCLEFDHVGEKRGNLNTLRQASLRVLFAEIEGCDVVCCRCHRARTRARLGERPDPWA
jgi:hypothetical protein